jgi:hypothetical protein
MSQFFCRPAGRTLVGLTLVAALGACVTAPPVSVIEAPGAEEPVAVVVAVVPEEGPQRNQWGGIVPEAKPTTPVENGALGEIGS